MGTRERTSKSNEDNGPKQKVIVTCHGLLFVKLGAPREGSSKNILHRRAHTILHMIVYTFNSTFLYTADFLDVPKFNPAQKSAT